MNNQHISLKVFLTLFICTVWISQISAQSKLDTLKLNRYIDTLSIHDKFMGSIALMKNGKIIYTKTVGYIDRDKDIKAYEYAKYKVGSISKTYTAVLVLKAVEKGLLRLDQTLDKFFPIIPNASQITIRQMLQHRSGIASITDDTSYYSFYLKPITEGQMTNRIHSLTPAFSPDEKSSYSNSNYILLSYILQKVYKKPFAKILAEEITQPIKLGNTRVCNKINPALKEAKSYRYRGFWIEQPETDVSVPMGAGNITSKPKDLLEFIHALFSGKILSQNMLKEMKTINGEFGLGITTIPYDGKLAYGHTGGIDGFVSIYSYFEDEKLGLAMMSNGVNCNLNDIIISVLNSYYGKPFEIPQYSHYKPKEDDIDLIVGEYENRRIGMEVQIFRENNVLMAQAIGQQAFPLEAVSKGVFRFDPVGVEMRFFWEKNTFILNQGGKEIEFTRKKTRN